MKKRRDHDVVIILNGKPITIKKFYTLAQKGRINLLEPVRIRQNYTTLYEGPVIGALELLEGLNLTKEEWGW